MRNLDLRYSVHLENEKATINSQIADLDALVSENEQQVSLLSAELVQLQLDIDGVQNQINTLTSEVEQLNSQEVSNLNQKQNLVNTSGRGGSERP